MTKITVVTGLGVPPSGVAALTVLVSIMKGAGVAFVLTIFASSIPSILLGADVPFMAASSEKSRCPFSNSACDFVSFLDVDISGSP